MSWRYCICLRLKVGVHKLASNCSEHHMVVPATNTRFAVTSLCALLGACSDLDSTFLSSLCRGSH